MKRVLGFVLVVCIALYAVVPMAAAQPTPVTRMGDWLEIGNEVYMNFIASTRIHYQTTHNYDFENDIQDRPNSRANQSTTNHDGESDIMYQESRLGFDLRYQKNLRARILLESQSTWDGNRIDNGFDLNGDSPETQEFRDGNNLSCDGDTGNCLQRNTVNLERAWIEYKFNKVVRFVVGAQLWHTDPAWLLGDDDPGFHVIITPTPNLEFSARAIIQNESQRLGLTNDNDNVYYIFSGQYSLKPYVFRLDVSYFRFRFQGAQGTSNEGQTIDSVLLMPSFTGEVGPISILLQPMAVFGTADASNSAQAAGQSDYDIQSYGIIAGVRVNLGRVTPFIGLVYGTGDDDTTDNDLEGFNITPQRDITLVGINRWFAPLTDAISIGDRDLPPPARNRGVSNGFGATEWLSTIFSPFNDRAGNGLHNGHSSTYSNPGTLKIPVGLEIVPVRDHTLQVFYIYSAVDDSHILEVITGASNIDESIYHEIGLRHLWRVNSHFNIEITGNVVFAGEGSKDVAELAFTCGDSGTEQCSGDDVALKAGIMFQARF